MSETDEQRRRRLGATYADQQALETLETIWDSYVLRPLFSETANSARDLGHTALDALDIKAHNLHPADASAYLRRGFTPHQAALLTTHEQAQFNLFAEDDYDEFINAPLLPETLTELLLVATSPAEARRLIADLTYPDAHPDDGESAQAVADARTTITQRAARANIDGSTCMCR